MASPTIKIPNESRKKKLNKSNDNVNNKTKVPIFQEYLPREELQRGLKTGELITGILRINQRNYEEAYISNPSGIVDILILGMPDRNRALHSDVVAVRVKKPTEWKMLGKGSSNVNNEDNVQKTAQVVAILEKKHTRVAVGQLRLMQDQNPRWALFSPIDARIPRMMIPATECPNDFFQRPQDFTRTLFIARIVDWQRTGVFARGSLCRSLGEAGEIEPETEGMLQQYGIEDKEFDADVLACLPSVPRDGGWQIPKEEFIYRKDLRNECVFTIDPTTARDLDDALHIKPSDEEGFYEVGVHIADVSWFIQSDTALDTVASKRATSVYLVHKVIPMLPRLLCEELCSLNPGVDRLTFSVIWKIDTNGKIVEEWFGRSVIRSCCKLTYDVAQGFIDEPDRVWSVDELPPISSGRSPTEISRCVRLLHKIAIQLRRKRFENGALRLDQPKLAFTLDKQTGLPNGCSVYQLKESNRLIEEFMLLANMAVAHRIYEHFPDTAFLRLHPPPKPKVMKEIVQLCRSVGYQIDPTSSASLQTSLQRYREFHDDGCDAVLSVLVQLLSKPMNLAQYFCSGTIGNEDDFRHYALSVPLYTHFTSPIRRYPDVIVHRMLAASLGYSDPVNLSMKQLKKLAEHCNETKVDAKAVSDSSADLFFNIFLKNCGPIEESAMVMGVMDHSFDVLIIRYGIIRRVYCNKLPLNVFSFNDEEIPPKLVLLWAPSGYAQTIKVFEKVTAVLSVVDGIKSMTVIKPPEEINQN